MTNKASEGKLKGGPSRSPAGALDRPPGKALILQGAEQGAEQHIQGPRLNVLGGLHYLKETLEEEGPTHPKL